MNKNETIRNLAMAITESPARTEKSPHAMPQGRIEERVAMAVPVDLVIAEETLVTERVVTINVSPHGARVVTNRRWRAEEQPWLASLRSYFRLQGKVVYCQPLTNGAFCVGLKFRASSIDWRDRMWS